jgi:anthranilate synthase/aminodeoxychorismate synthase-like glutamine amidotransferase
VLLVLDNRDSFTFNLVQLLASLGADVEVRRAATTSLDEVRALAPERILIGPGPGAPAAAALSLEVIRELSPRVPILGVCLGHQAIGHAVGARVERDPAPLHGSAVRIEHDGGGVFAGLPSSFRATRYNSLRVCADDLPDELALSARDERGAVMGLRHRSRPLEGVQFHPESILSERGAELMANFLAR